MTNWVYRTDEMFYWKSKGTVFKNDSLIGFGTDCLMSSCFNLKMKREGKYISIISFIFKS